MSDREPNLDRARVLVSAASKHGSTAEIAESIAAGLRDRGFDVALARPEQVTVLDEYDAVVLGSAVYAGHWMKDARDLAERIGTAPRSPTVWLFSSGPLGDPPKPDEDPVDVEAIYDQTSAREHRVFAGKIDKSKLSFGERAIMVAVRAPEGDFRDWDEIAEWADGIADELEAQARAS